MTIMRHTFLGLCAVLAMATVTAAAAQGNRPNMLVEFTTETGTIDSAVLKEKRTHTVYLPPSYAAAAALGQTGHRRFPVVYLVTGTSYADFFSAIIGHLAFTGQIPDMIVVSIESPFSITSNRLIDTTPTKANPNSQGDPAENRYGGGAKPYFDYIARELVPHIDTNYRTTAQRTVVGHSVGGLAVLYNFLSQPGTFQHYLSLDASAWWDDQVIIRLLEDALEGSDKPRGRLYMAVSEKETTGFHDDTGMLVGNLRFFDILERHRLPGVEAELKLFPGTNHGTVLLPALFEGFLYLWGGYLPHRSDILFPGGGKARLLAHMQAYSEKTGATVPPHEGFVDGIAEAAGEHAEKLDDPEKAAFYAQLQIDLLKLNLETFPASSRARVKIAKYYENKNDRQKAIRYYEEALQLDSEDQNARTGLDALTGKQPETLELTPEDMAAFVARYEGEGFAPTTLSVVDGALIMRIDGIDVDLTPLAKSRTELFLPRNQGGGTIELIKADGAPKRIILRLGNGTFELTAVGQ